MLLTGATGFIGGHLLARLAADGAEVHAVSRRPPAEHGRARWHEADLAEVDAVRRVVSEVSPDLIFHVAGETRAARDLELVLPAFRSNLVTTVNLLSAAAEASPSTRVVLAGSLEEPEAGEPASSPYAASKAAAGLYGRLFGEMFDLRVTALRIFMVYGPGQRDLSKLVPHVILSLLRSERPQLTTGQRMIDWIYVDDVVDAFVAAATHEPVAAAVDVGTGRAVAIRAVVTRLVEMIDATIEPEYGAISDRPHEQVRVADIAATEQAIGWRPKVELEDGLLRTARWYREQLNLGRL